MTVLQRDQNTRKVNTTSGSRDGAEPRSRLELHPVSSPRREQPDTVKHMSAGTAHITVSSRDTIARTKAVDASQHRRQIAENSYSYAQTHTRTRRLVNAHTRTYSANTTSLSPQRMFPDSQLLTRVQCHTRSPSLAESRSSHTVSQTFAPTRHVGPRCQCTAVHAAIVSSRKYLRIEDAKRRSLSHPAQHKARVAPPSYAARSARRLRCSRHTRERTDTRRGPFSSFSHLPSPCCGTRARAGAARPR